MAYIVSTMRPARVSNIRQAASACLKSTKQPVRQPLMLTRATKSRWLEQIKITNPKGDKIREDSGQGSRTVRGRNKSPHREQESAKY
jgi:hypothetical protein